MYWVKGRPGTIFNGVPLSLSQMDGSAIGDQSEILALVCLPRRLDKQFLSVFWVLSAQRRTPLAKYCVVTSEEESVAGGRGGNSTTQPGHEQNSLVFDEFWV